jgi:hypothetical protein
MKASTLPPDSIKLPLCWVKLPPSKRRIPVCASMTPSFVNVALK